MYFYILPNEGMMYYAYIEDAASNLSTMLYGS